MLRYIYMNHFDKQRKLLEYKGLVIELNIIYEELRRMLNRYFTHYDNDITLNELLLQINAYDYALLDIAEMEDEYPHVKGAYPWLM